MQMQCMQGTAGSAILTLEQAYRQSDISALTVEFCFVTKTKRREKSKNYNLSKSRIITFLDGESDTYISKQFAVLAE
jgi:hypothetical protein